MSWRWSFARSAGFLVRALFAAVVVQYLSDLAGGLGCPGVGTGVFTEADCVTPVPLYPLDRHTYMNLHSLRSQILSQRVSNCRILSRNDAR